MNTSVQPALMAAIFVAAITAFFFQSAPSDFLAVYFAGLQYGAEHFDQVYPAVAPVFDLSYPASWDALAQARGVPETTRLFPFIYPPLWAAVASLIPPLSIASITGVLAFANACLLLACSWLGWRITRSTLPLTLWLTLGFVSMATTTFGFVALSQGQPQILTTFLILVAIERAQSRAPMTAGLALALAASIKLYPLLLVVIWLARRDWRASASFALAGTALAAASVAIAGWPLHAAFLAQIGIIADSVLLSPLSYNLNAIATALSLDLSVTIMPHTAPTNPALALINKLALLASLAVTFWAARQSTDRALYTRIWPLLLIAVSFFSPMSWSYHFLTALAFAPLAFAQTRIAPKLYLIYICIAASIVTTLVIGQFLPRDTAVFVVGVSSLAALTLLFCVARPKWTPTEGEPLLHP